MDFPDQANRLPNFARSALVFLSEPNPECEDEFVAACLRSEALHQPWVFPPCCHEEYQTYLERIRTGRTIAFLVRRSPDSQLAGVINISESVMGIFQSAYLGFYAFAGYERRGYMTAGLALVLDRAFNELGFHRLEANVQPGNLASAALVARLGFRKEGFSPRYLFIDGAWRDHDRWAILAEDWLTYHGKLSGR
jgi:ribosomal-protein-alanine N-acetyltransferase